MPSAQTALACVPTAQKQLLPRHYGLQLALPLQRTRRAPELPFLWAAVAADRPLVRRRGSPVRKATGLGEKENAEAELRSTRMFYETGPFQQFACLCVRSVSRAGLGRHFGAATLGLLGALSRSYFAGL